MGKTIYLGNTSKTKWASSNANRGRLLGAFIDDNGNYNGVPFSLTRNSPAYSEENGVLTEAGIDEPKFKDGKLLLEGEATNLALWSEDVGQSSYSKTNISTDLNSALFLNNQMIADKLIPNNGTTNARLVNRSLSLLDNTKYTYSAFVKRGEYKYAQIWINSLSLVNDSYFGSGTYIDLDTGVSSDDNIVKVEKHNDNWYRISITFTTTTNFGNSALTITPRNEMGSVNAVIGDGVSGIFSCGQQIEVEDKATSYIATEGSTQTRQADTNVKNLVDLSEEINLSEGVFVVQAAALGNESYSRSISLVGDTNNFLYLQWRDIDNLIRFRIVANGVTIKDQSTSITVTDNNIFTIVFSSNGSEYFVNGVSVWKGVDSVNFALLKELKLDINTSPTANSYFQGELDQIRIYPSIQDAVNDGLTYLQ